MHRARLGVTVCHLGPITFPPVLKGHKATRFWFFSSCNTSGKQRFVPAGPAATHPASSSHRAHQSSFTLHSTEPSTMLRRAEKCALSVRSIENKRIASTGTRAGAGFGVCNADFTNARFLYMSRIIIKRPLEARGSSGTRVPIWTPAREMLASSPSSSPTAYTDADGGEIPSSPTYP